MHSDALKRLIEKVEGGTLTGNDPRVYAEGMIEFIEAAGINPAYHADDVAVAHDGSLDAAAALHNALLPGWTACIGQNAHHNDWNAFVRLADNGGIAREHWGGTDDNPARAWLLAILKAKLAEAEHTGGIHE